ELGLIDLAILVRVCIAKLGEQTWLHHGFLLVEEAVVVLVEPGEFGKGIVAGLLPWCHRCCGWWFIRRLCCHWKRRDQPGNPDKRCPCAGKTSVVAKTSRNAKTAHRQGLVSAASSWVAAPFSSSSSSACCSARILSTC